ncbi:sulfur deprivation response regulator [Oceanobacillus iheyensis HTE831]|uniref:Sulfur deprivation response regulator n=1 Tax=Oceanobacillus iheyensis (strain DSM 14371 / CIP 107618 / JCM 11309 / KCTC 3954 / HTE831) TaxID=221109 RepID=Q8EQN4_OCEIH|nr:SLC13 family permease [Oceanobacillus iheyensis]BAC13616.1 sulfur deprivation response regulator [Oceanobacillus iheyensis HTE831]
MIFVLLMVIAMLGALLFEVASPSIVVFTVLTVFLITGILNPSEALSGFSNEGMITVGLLFVVAGAVKKSGILEDIMKSWMAGSHRMIDSVARFFIPVSLLSGFLNNTPIVVTFMPIVKGWCEERGIAPSKFLIPLSYVTILGGTITVLGTSTNLVVHGMLIDYGYGGFTLFQLAIVGIPITIVGLIYIFTIGSKLLPENKGLQQQIDEDPREYLAELIVDQSFPYANQSIKNAGLRNLKGLYLIEIIRDKERISPVRPTTIIQTADRLIFTGLIETLRDVQMTKGLTLRTGTDLELRELKNGNSEIVEVVIAHQSSLQSKTIKQLKFRSKFEAGVIAVHRESERIASKIGDIVLKPGDTLLLLADKDFVRKYKHSKDFYILTSPDTTETLRIDPIKGWFTIILFFGMIALVTLGVFTMFKAMTMAVVLLLLFKVIKPGEAKKYIHFDVLLLIASSFGIGLAITKTGLAEYIAKGILMLGKPAGLVILLLLIYILTNIFTEIITNSAAAVLMFPVGMEMARNLHVEPMGFAVIIAIAASASFITPIGYQTNMIVYGPGGYKFIDYVKIGTPLSLIVMVLTVSIVSYWWY